MAAILGSAILGLGAAGLFGIGPAAKPVQAGIGFITEPITGAKADRKKAEKLAKEQEDKQAALELEVEQKEATATSQAAGKKARKRQKAKSAGTQGRRGTLLTGPLGLVGEPETAGKTLLGA